jgi:hypothetical protein
VWCLCSWGLKAKRRTDGGTLRIFDGPALIDPGHWAGEWPWLPVAAQRLADDAAADGTTVEVDVSSVVTDPWTDHLSFDPKE